MECMCGQCHKQSFPEGMYVFECQRCHLLIHPGCWREHARFHGDEFLAPLKGKVGPYGIIHWEHPASLMTG